MKLLQISDQLLKERIRAIATCRDVAPAEDKRNPWGSVRCGNHPFHAVWL
jgi:hypothetical protein